MIDFRCWYCNRRYTVAEQRTGERLTCSCQRPLRIPRSSGGNSQVKTVSDRVVEAVVYGGGGALLGLGLAVLILSQVREIDLGVGGAVVMAVLTGVGFLAGLLGGERGVNWVGRMIRNRESQ
jgi:hypothetical protein